MAHPRFQNLSSVDRPLALQARADIRSSSVAFSGQSGQVLKDPLTLELFHLTAEEYFLFDSLRETTSLSQLRKDFEERFAPRRVSYDSLQQGLNNLYRQGLLLGDAVAQGQELMERSDRRRRSERLQSFFQLLSFRLGSIDATRLVDGLYGKIRWVFSWPIMLAALSAVLYCSWILLGHGREVFAKLPTLNELAQPRYLLLWLATVVVVKVIHELAHATTCQHFGGRCHEIGVLMLAFIPCLYCDVSDVWRLPSKWQRIAVSAAGMIAELVIAAVALIVWWHTEPGLLHTWCLSLVVVCSIGTLLINVNPLLRYDGYYILSDLVEVPNLSGRSQGLLPAALKRWLLGQRQSSDSLLSKSQRRGLVVYAVASRVYMTLVLLGIFVMLLTWTRPYRLENLVYTLGAFVLIGLLIRPLPSIWQIFRNPTLRASLRGFRLFTLGAGFAMVLVAMFYWPIGRTVTGPVVFVPADGQAVYAAASGELQYAVAPGTRVAEGDVIARLAAPELEMARVEQHGEQEVRQVRFEQLSSMRAWNAQASELLPTAEAALADAQSQLEQIQQREKKLVITAPTSGVIVAPPDVEQQDSEKNRLSPWSGSPLDERNLGSWIEPGTVFCMVGDSERLEALLAIDQADVAEVRPGQAVRILLDAAPVCVIEGEVVQVGRRTIQPSAPETTSELASSYHLIHVRLNEQLSRLVVGSHGKAKIEASQSTIGELLISQLRRMFRLPW